MQELNQYALWAAKQAAKGAVPALAAFTRRFKQVAGDLNTARDEGSENYSDLTEFGDATDFVNTLLGSGTPGLQGTPDELAWLLYIFHGGETTSAVAGPPAKTKHHFEPLGTPGFWAAFFRRLGATDVSRAIWADGRITSLVIEGATGQKVVRVTPSITSLDPQINQAADPAAALPAAKPFLFTDGTGRFKIDTVVFEGHSRFQLTLNRELTPVYGDGESPFDLVPGNSRAQIEVTAYMDAAGLAFFNKKFYGTATPAAGQKPLRTVGTLGSYQADLRSRNDDGTLNGNKLFVDAAGVRWQLPDAPGPNPDGGAAELTLTGQMRRSGASDLYNVDVDCDAAAFV